MTAISLKTILESAIFAAGEPVSLDRLISLLESEAEKPSRAEVKQALETLQEEYQDRPIHLKEVASGYTFQVQSEFSPWIQKLWEEKPQRHSRALLETLAIIAYRQPITRAEIEEIRGVAVSTQMVRTLLEQEWIRVVGQREVPGRPSLYATTPFFLDYFNLKSLSELPSLMELKVLREEEAEALKAAALGHIPAADEGEAEEKVEKAEAETVEAQLEITEPEEPEASLEEVSGEALSEKVN